MLAEFCLSQNHVYDEHTHTLQIYWSNRDVINWLAENSDDEHLKKVKQNAEQHALKMEVASRSVHDESALFDEDEAEDDEIVLGREDKREEEKETSEQRLYSLAKVKPEFEGLRAPSSGHKIQDIKELMTVPVRYFPTTVYFHSSQYRLLSPPISLNLHLSSKCTVSIPTPRRKSDHLSDGVSFVVILPCNFAHALFPFPLF
jgi:hypothetical protein